MNAKKLAAIEAAKLVKDGMIVGLGTGSTAVFFVEEIGRRIREENLKIEAVATSNETDTQALDLGIPLVDIDRVDLIDLTVDGADEVDAQFNGIKGGGGALLREKIVAVNSRECIWIIDESKYVAQLGVFPLAVEVVKYGAKQLFKKFEEADYKPTWRKESSGTRIVTDQKHFIIDLHLGKIENVFLLNQLLNETVGVVEHGLFLEMAQQLIVGYTDGHVEILKKSSS